MGIAQHFDPPVAFGSRQGALIALQIVFVLIALVIYSLRLYTRARILRSSASDDYLMGVAMLFSIALTVNACISTRYGWGKHLHQVPFSDLSSVLLCIWLAELIFTITTSFVKISILFFYLRIAVTRTYRRVIYGSIGLIIVWAITFSFVVILQCRPVSDYWDPLAPTSHCYNPEAALIVHGVTNTVTDVYVYVLPMRMVWQTQLPKRQRIGLLVIFGAGFLVCVSGALRLYYSIVNLQSYDATWEGFDLWTWESIEVNLGIVCASAPCLKALISRVLPRFMGSHASEISHTPGAQYGVRRDGGGKHYVLDNRRSRGIEVRTDVRVERQSVESEGSRELLTRDKGPKEVVLFAKVEGNGIV